MRISDWSSDVCSSDLRTRHFLRHYGTRGHRSAHPARRALSAQRLSMVTDRPAALHHHRGYLGDADSGVGDRKSVVEGKSVSVRVDLGGRRIIKKKKTLNTD